MIVGNTESGTLVAIPVQSDGTAGAVEMLVMDTTELCGIDGLVGDTDGYLATVLGSVLVSISADGSSIEELHAGAPFLTPSGVDVGTFGSARQALVVNPDFEAAFGAGGPSSAMPNLTAVPR